MFHSPKELALRWRLSTRDRVRLADAAHDARVAATLDDIDRALVWLLADHQAIRDWLRRPHPALYHATPLAIILGTADGREMLRTELVEEAAACGDAAAAMATGVEP
jgi:uncharacterized protein (DUF2384 family)